jgi:hypothetical protein
MRYLPAMQSSSSRLTVGSFPSLTVQQLNRPADTHYDICKYAIERNLHVLVTKPAVQTLAHHNELIKLAKKHRVVCFVEHHKR